MSERAHAKAEERKSYLVALAVIAVSVGVGLFGLPRLGRRAPRSESSLVGRPAPDFMLRALDGTGLGKTQRLSDLQGKTVLLDFFASWCGPCRQQAPIVERVAQRLAGEKLAVYGVDTSDQFADAVHHFEQHPPSYSVLFDADNDAANAFDVTGLPTVLVIDKGGIVRAVETGVVGQSELEGLIKEAQGS